jgi:hypothetical protein
MLAAVNNSRDMRRMIVAKKDGDFFWKRLLLIIMAVFAIIIDGLFNDSTISSKFQPWKIGDLCKDPWSSTELPL